MIASKPVKRYKLAGNLMRTILVVASFVVVPFVLAACQSAQTNVAKFGQRNTMRFALNKPYQQIANTPDLSETNLLKIGKTTTYGPMIGSFQLANGDTVYRHLKPYETGNSSVGLGLIGGESTSFTLYLAYFRVDASGIVRDWAGTALPGSSQRCVGFFGGIIRNCSDTAAQERSLQYYDNLVRTSSDQPLSAWGPRATATPVATQPATTVALVQ